jgi:uncharacterized protein (TIGR02284 family)
MADRADDLKSLHTALIDSRNGYQEALEDAGPRGLTTLFQQMIALRTQHSAALETYLVNLGEQPSEDGSFMSTVHRTVIGIRSLFGELDERILPGLIDGEERIRGYYDEAIETAGSGGAERQTLMTQRAELDEVIASMQARSDSAA